MRIWIDTMTMAAMPENKQLNNLNALINQGHTLVVANTACDVRLFQENLGWFETMLQKSSIIIEIWVTPDEMVKKNFYWSSCSMETTTAATIEDAVMNLPNAAGILDVADLVDTYGIPKGSWTMGQWAPSAPLSAEDAAALGVDTATTRTDILAAAKAANRLDVFDSYNIGYNRGLANQHCCEAILNSDGSYTAL